MSIALADPSGYVQGEFCVNRGGYVKSIADDQAYNYAVAADLFRHRGIGWIYTNEGELLVKDSGVSEDADEDAGACHVQLFGTCALVRSRYRGWFSKGILTVQDRLNKTDCIQEIPDYLFSALQRQFRFELTKIRLL